MTVELTVTLPEQVAREAEANGLLKSESLERLLRDEIRRRRVGELFDAADRLAALPEPPLTDAEVPAEIQAAGAERRARHKENRPTVEVCG
jgi:hypothetical protein